MSEHVMEYNSNSEKLILPEYGRNIQELVNHAKEIEDLEARQVFVEKIVNLMMQMHPYNKNIEDHREKLWRHVFQIANYDIEGVLTPSGVQPTPENTVLQPQKLEYPKSKARFRHYGNNVQDLVDKALAMEEGPIRDGFARAIAIYMKLAYKTWNKDHFVSDEVVKSDLSNLSNGVLLIPESENLNYYFNSNSGGGGRGGSSKRSNGGKSSGGKSNQRSRRKK